jgi:DNA-binding LacI/PurR family transcriptional regulator
MVNQKQIADRLNLSRSLVSKVLNNNLGTTKVKPETAQAIRDMADQLGYSPNQVAVSLATGKKGAIGVVIRRFGTRGSRLPDMLTDGFSEEARLTGQKLVLTYYGDDTVSRCLEFLTHSDQIDGLIFAGSIPLPIVDELPRYRGFPVVAVCSQVMPPDTSSVLITNTYIGEMATTHLIHRGCRRIALIESWPVRSEGFFKAMELASLPVHEELLFHCNGFSHHVGTAAVENFLSKGQKFDGIVAQSDDQAAGAINTLISHGIRVPEDVKVIGVDNSPFCEFCACPLSSIDQNFYEAGRVGLKMLTELIADPGLPPRNEVIRPLLIARRSTE